MAFEERQWPPEDPHTRSFVASIRASGVDVGALVDRLKVNEINEELISGYIGMLQDHESDSDKRVAWLEENTDNRYQLYALLIKTETSLWKQADTSSIDAAVRDPYFLRALKVLDDMGQVASDSETAEIVERVMEEYSEKTIFLGSVGD